MQLGIGQTCTCPNTYKYKGECVICGEVWHEFTEEQLEAMDDCNRIIHPASDMHSDSILK